MSIASFGPSSRYNAVPVLTWTGEDGTVEVYLGRRILPAVDRHVAAEHRRVRRGERPDTIADDSYGDPELWWRIVDATGEADPAQISDVDGRLLMVPLPLEVSDDGHA
ncbi:hypothetical protein HP550_20355 [Cellulomonas humilata]|uniref:LysM domain-containing protein n=1 Tax=Cellulomonas humilata TaxID=144055 RepID=A0A7Y6A4G2_9CELL|nr:hypothetical protein [Cellulomonas humilata]NUU19603.1 hypothetical protein [Cellulomonas humilata]